MDISDYSLPLIFIASFIAIFAATEIGRQLGLLAARRKRENISTIEGAVLGLLALLIAFTFSMALSLFEARRDALLNEANAVGTTALRARLLPAPYNTECLKLLREYIQISAGYRPKHRSVVARGDCGNHTLERDSGGAVAAGKGGSREGQCYGADGVIHPVAE